jgi:acetyl-CoA acyltransferase
MEIVIAEAVRSAVGRGHKGSLATKRPDELAADVIRGLLARVPQAKGKIDDVVLGCAMPEGEQGLNVARLISLLADLGPDVPAQTINRFCSSGLQARCLAAGWLRALAKYHEINRGRVLIRKPHIETQTHR